MPCGQDACGNPALDRRGELEETDTVRDGRPGPPDPVGELGLRHVELVEQLLVRGRLLQGIELHSVDVLEQGVAEEVLVLRLTDDRGDRRQLGPLARAPAALAHDELIPAAGHLTDDNRLQ